MSSSSSNAPLPAQLKIPTFNTSTFRLAQIVPDRSNTTIIGGVGGGAAKKQQPPIRLGTPSITSTAIATTTITTTKISVDGKVIDIDVLTKLHQKNGGGNIVSFTASRELLSNLANNKPTKNVVVPAKITSSNHPLQQQTLKATSTGITLYSAQGIKQVNTGKTTTGVKLTSNEKFLLPKTTTTHTVGQYPLKKCQVEVKKFAPEMNGLLSGLRGGAAVPATATAVSGDMKSIKAYNMKNQAVAISFIGENKKTKGATTMLLPTKALSNATTHQLKTIIHNPTVVKTYPPHHPQYITKTTKKPLLPQAIHHQPVCKQEATSNKYILSVSTSPPTKGLSSTPTPAIVENKTYRTNKNILENNKKSSFKIQTLLLQDALKKENERSTKTMKKENNEDGLEG